MKYFSTVVGKLYCRILLFHCFRRQTVFQIGMKIGVCLAFGVVFTATHCNAKEIIVGKFNHNDLAGWTQKVFAGHTVYRLVNDGGKSVVQATSDNSASSLIKTISFDPRKFRYLKWSWKINHILKKGDARSKKGDDYAARIYIVFPGTFFWQTKAINYIWANHLQKGASLPSPFTGHSMMIAVESGSKLAGHWVSEKRDIVADYHRVFGSYPQQGEAVAIMTDTDNTHENAVAWYGDITLSINPAK